MKNVIIISKCLDVVSLNDTESMCKFHFTGAGFGEPIRHVELVADKSLKIQKDSEYLMYVRMESLKNGTLKGTVIKAKLLDESWDAQ